MEATPPAAEEELRTVLTELVETGEPLGSGGMIIMEQVEALRETDSAKADALAGQVDGLMAEQNPAQVKAKAQAMLDEL